MPELTKEQITIIKFYVDQCRNQLINAFWNADIKDQYTVIIEDADQKTDYEVTVKKIVK